jgi:hypothetical protein
MSCFLFLLLYLFWIKALEVHLDNFEPRFPGPSEFEKYCNMVVQVSLFLALCSFLCLIIVTALLTPPFFPFFFFFFFCHFLFFFYASEFLYEMI